LGGPLAYPGSIESTTSEGIHQTKKGFFEVDISTSEAIPEWLELEIRPQFSSTTNFDDLEKTVDDLLNEIKGLIKKPIVELLVQGNDLKTDVVQAQVARLIPYVLHCAWKLSKQVKDSSVFLDRPARIDDEMLKC